MNNMSVSVLQQDDRSILLCNYISVIRFCWYAIYRSAVCLSVGHVLTVTHWGAATIHTVVSIHCVQQQQQQPFNGLFSRTTWVSRYQKCKTNLDFTRARDSEWQWHQLGHMQVCTSLQTDNHASTPPLCFYRPDALPAAQPTVSKH